MTDSKCNDDRPSRAEDTLGELGKQAEGDAESISTRGLFRQFFGELPERILRLRREGDPRTETLIGPGREQERLVAAGRGLPTSPPVAVPNHQLIRCLGAGAFGQVWLAKHTLTEHYRACKLVPETRAIELQGLRQLKQRVPSHPHLLPVEDVGASGGWLYCLMPLADNAASDGAVLDASGYEPLDLATYLRRKGRLPSREVCELGAVLGGALGHLHAHGVTHGDVKPANLLRHAGRWALADYGLMSQVNSTKPTGGTPGYVPPEGPGGRAADQFALGVVLMEMLTGWSFRTLDDFRSTPIDQLGLDKSAVAVRQVVLRATADTPEHRFGSMNELADALRAAHRSRRAGSGGRRVGLLVVATFAVLAGATWLGIMLLDRSPDSADARLAATALRIESFEVKRYRYEPRENITVEVGVLGSDTPAANVDDDVTVHASFSSPAYCYLLSLDTNGRVMCRLPESRDVEPAALTTLRYPAALLYRLTIERGPGAQGFMVIASSRPLPPWSEFVASHGLPVWPAGAPIPQVLVYDGSRLTPAGAPRDPTLPRGDRIVRRPLDWSRPLPGVDARHLVIFPVLPLDASPPQAGTAAD